MANLRERSRQNYEPAQERYGREQSRAYPEAGGEDYGRGEFQGARASERFQYGTDDEDFESEGYSQPSQGQSQPAYQGQGGNRSTRSTSSYQRDWSRPQDTQGEGGFSGSRSRGDGNGNRSQQQQYRGPHAGKGPRGYQRSDDRITEDINEALTQDGDLNAEDIQVTVKNGECTLTGTVESRECKRQAERLAEEVSGCKDVQNQLRVAQSQSGATGQSTERSRQGKESATTRT